MVWDGPAVQERAPVDQHLAGITSPALLGRSLWCPGQQSLPAKGSVGLVSTSTRPGAAATAWRSYLFFIPSLVLLGCHRREVPLQPPSQAEILVLITN